MKVEHSWHSGGGFREYHFVMTCIFMKHLNCFAAGLGVLLTEKLDFQWVGTADINPLLNSLHLWK
jgi:hypothetical protein